MTIIDLNEEQVEDIETRLSSYDENHITYKMDGCIQINCLGQPLILSQI